MANITPPEDPTPVAPDHIGDDDHPTKPAAPAKRQKTLMARDITSETWVISNEEDLEKNLDKIRARVKEELAKNDIVQLKF